MAEEAVKEQNEKAEDETQTAQDQTESEEKAEGEEEGASKDADGEVPSEEETKAIMFCSPSNPTGCVIPEEELAKLAEVIKKHQIWCLSDEIYCELVYDETKHVSIASYPGLKDYTIVMNGFS